jgi:hypothetical protein
MRSAYHKYVASKGTPTLSDVKARKAEADELKLARIQNGVEPSHQNGSCCRCCQTGRKAGNR